VGAKRYVEEWIGHEILHWVAGVMPTGSCRGAGMQGAIHTNIGCELVDGAVTALCSWHLWRVCGRRSGSGAGRLKREGISGGRDGEDARESLDSREIGDFRSSIFDFDMGEGHLFLEPAGELSLLALE